LAYGLAEGLRNSAGKLAPKGKKAAIIVGTFGSHFKLNEALEKIKQNGFTYEVEKGHTVKVFLGKNTTENAEKVRSIIREHYGYVEPL
jgi:hypothetical protein